MKKPKENTQEILKIVIVLTVIALVSGLLLGIMNKVTYVDKQETLLKEIKSLYNAEIVQVDIADYQNLADTQILNAFCADDGAYIIESKSDKAYSSSGLKLIVVIKDGKVIKINGKGNSETPGLGSKALADSYLKQYIGIGYDYFDADQQQEQQLSSPKLKIEWKLIKDEQSSNQTAITPTDEITAISGATKSSDGVRYVIKAALAFYQSMEGNNA